MRSYSWRVPALLSYCILSLGLLQVCSSLPKGPQDVLKLKDFGIDPSEVKVHLDNPDVSSWAETWEPPEKMRKFFPYYKTGTDDDGAPVYVKEFGRWRFADFVSGLGNNSRAMFDKYYEQYVHRVQKDGENAGVNVIFDFDGFSMANFDDREAIKLALRQLSTLERTSKVLKRVFLININFPAQTLLNAARPLLGTVLESAEMYGTQKDKWMPKLLRALPRSTLPEKYTGDSNEINDSKKRHKHKREVLDGRT